MSTRRKPEARCEICVMRRELCLCADIAIARTALANQSTRVMVLMHHRERFLSTNTARLAKLCLPQCSVHLRGMPQAPLKLQADDLPKNQCLFLFPSDDAIELNSEMLNAFKRPITLIVPDGSWRQAFKVAKREPMLSGIPRVKLPIGAASRYHLRSEPKPEGLATFEAIARSLGIIESPRQQKIMEDLFNLMVSRTMRSRGTPINDASQGSS